MNKETYEALRRIMDIVQKKIWLMTGEKGKTAKADRKQIEDWIDEVGKEYEE